VTCGHFPFTFFLIAGIIKENLTLLGMLLPAQMKQREFLKTPSYWDLQTFDADAPQQVEEP
jgi:hypothetical protein